MTESECLAIVTGLVAAYPREMGETTLAVYVSDLRDCDPEALMRAVVALRRTSKWLPTIAEVRAEIAKADTRFPDAAVAWDEAVRLMARVGSYGTPKGGTPAMRRALQLCGRWEDICQEDMTWLRKRFVEVYAGVVSEAQTALQIGGEAPAWLERRENPAQLTASAGVTRLVTGLATAMGQP